MMNERLKRINRSTLDLHGTPGAADAFAFDSLHEHVDEVRDLMATGDSHWKAETMDIILHGYLMLDRHQVLPAETASLMDCRLDRFQEKITAALKAERPRHG